MIKLKSILKEIGEGTTPYKWSGPEEKFGTILYFFTTEDGDYYKVLFDGMMENDWELIFYSNSYTTDDDTSYIGIVTNKGRQFKIISTIMDIIQSFITEYPVDRIFFTGADKKGTKSSSNQRNMLYTAYVKKNINKLQGWDYEIRTGGGIILFRKESLPGMELKSI